MICPYCETEVKRVSTQRTHMAGVDLILVGCDACNKVLGVVRDS